MRIYLQFLGWLLRKFKFNPIRPFQRMLKSYRQVFLDSWPFALILSILMWLLLSLFVLISCAMIQTPIKQEIIDYEFYCMIFMQVFVVYNWLAAWYGVFEKERQALMDTLARP
jgi:hypothetical protein